MYRRIRIGKWIITFNRFKTYDKSWSSEIYFLPSISLITDWETRTLIFAWIIYEFRISFVKERNYIKTK